MRPMQTIAKNLKRCEPPISGVVRRPERTCFTVAPASSSASSLSRGISCPYSRVRPDGNAQGSIVIEPEPWSIAISGSATAIPPGGKSGHIRVIRLLMRIINGHLELTSRQVEIRPLMSFSLVESMGTGGASSVNDAQGLFFFA